MLKLSTSFSKKVPIPGQDFSSQSFHAAVELELSDASSPEQIRSRIHDTFTMVKSAVESEINGRVTDQAQGERAVAAPPEQTRTAGPDKASNKQIKFITDLAARQRTGIADLNASIRERYGVAGLYDLTRRQASELLDAMNGKSQRKAA